MDLADVEREFGPDAHHKWVWTAQPRFVFEEDGSDRSDFVPVTSAAEVDFEDTRGWWTCHPSTRLGDLAVIYRSSGDRDPDFPVRGPKDIAYVALVTSDAPFRLDLDPFAVEAGLGDMWACHFAILSKIDPPVGIQELRADPILSTWPALKASFVKAALPMPEEIWRRFVEIAASDEGTRAASVRRPRAAIRSVRLEAQLEKWLAENLDALRDHGLDLELIGTQRYCKGHEGVIDILCRRRGQPDHVVVIELKVGEVQRDAVGQVLGYLGWVRRQRGVSAVAGVLIGGCQQAQVPYALDEVSDAIQWIDWDSLDLPTDLRAALD